MFGAKSGTWWVKSESDPRWNGVGRTGSLLFSAGPPPEALAHIDTMKQTLGEPPDDLEYGGMKD